MRNSFRGAVGARRAWRTLADVVGQASAVVLPIIVPVLAVKGVIWVAKIGIPKGRWGETLVWLAILVSGGLIALSLRQIGRWTKSRFVLGSILAPLVTAACLGAYAIGLQIFGRYHDPNGLAEILSGGVQGLVAVVVLMAFLIAADGWGAEATHYIEELGPSVSYREAVLIVLGAGLAALLAVWAAHEGVEGRCIPVLAGQIALALFFVACIALPPLIRLANDFGEPFHAPRGRWFPTGVVFDFIRYLLTPVDFLLVRVVGWVAGARIQQDLLRYAALGVHLGAAILTLLFWRSPWALLAAAWAVVVTLAMARRWVLAELDLERSLEQGDGGGLKWIESDRDLYPEALLSLGLLTVFVAPLALETTARAFPWFVWGAGPEPGYLEWAGFLGSELIKAAPLLDWSEVYHVENLSALRPNTAEGYHVVFIIRALIDLVIITAIVRAVSTSTSLRRTRERFHDPLDRLNRLHGRDQRNLMRRVGRDWRQCNESFPVYDEARLQHMLFDDDLQAARGAARIAGWQFAKGPLFTLVTADPLEGEDRQKIRAELEREAAEGLERRADALEGAVPMAHIALITAGLRKRTEEISEDERKAILLALDELARRREIETIVGQQEAAASDGRRYDFVKRLEVLLRDEDQTLLLQHLRSKSIVLARTAALVLRHLPTKSAETEAALIDAAMTAPPAVRDAAIQTLGHRGGKAAFDFLAENFRQAGRSAYTHLALLDLAERGLHRDDVIATVRDVLQGSADREAKIHCIDVLKALRAKAAADDFLRIVNGGLNPPRFIVLLPWLKAPVSDGDRIRAIQGLAWLGNPTVIGPLEAMLRKRPRSRRVRDALHNTIANLQEEARRENSDQ